MQLTPIQQLPLVIDIYSVIVIYGHQAEVQFLFDYARMTGFNNIKVQYIQAFIVIIQHIQ